MGNEKSEKSEKTSLELAFEVLEKEEKIPILLWNEKKDENKDFLFEYQKMESDNVMNVLLFKDKKAVEYQISITPSALNTQFLKFKPEEKDIFSIKFLGTKKNPDTSKPDFKSFIVKKFDVRLQKFVTTKNI